MKPAPLLHVATFPTMLRAFQEDEISKSQVKCKLSVDVDPGFVKTKRKKMGGGGLQVFGYLLANRHVERKQQMSYSRCSELFFR